MTALNPVKTIGDQVMETILIHKAMPQKAQGRRARAKRGAGPGSACLPTKVPFVALSA